MCGLSFIFIFLFMENYFIVDKEFAAYDKEEENSGNYIRKRIAAREKVGSKVRRTLIYNVYNNDVNAIIKGLNLPSQATNIAVKPLL